MIFKKKPKVDREVAILKATQGARRAMLAELEPLGSEAAHECYFTALAGLATHCCSGGNSLSDDEAKHNATCFTGMLLEGLEASAQKKTRRLM